MSILRSGSATHVGQVRQVNEDAIVESISLYAVADGMGGAAAGEVASSIAIEALQAAYATMAPSLSSVRRAVEAANAAVYEAATAEPTYRGMGTTLTVVAPVTSDDGHERVVVANVGDSRCYLFAEGGLRQLTHDHSVAAEKVRSGELSEAQAAAHPQRHMLTRVMGVDEVVAVDLFELPVRSGDRLLICSDGLSNELTSGQVANILATIAEPRAAAQALVEAANAHGGRDNVTVVVVDVVVGDDEEQDRDLNAFAPISSNDRSTNDDDLTGAVPVVAPPTPEPTDDHKATSGVHGTPIASGSYAVLHQTGVIEPVVRKRSRLVTLRVLLFFALLGGIAYGGYAFITWFAASQYFVANHDGVLVIYQGQPGGTLWIAPKLVATSKVTTAEILRARLDAVAVGVREPNRAAAWNYIHGLHQEWTLTQATTTTTSTTTTTTPSSFAGVARLGSGR